MERNFHSRWGELDLIAVKINESDYENEMYFDETAEGMNADATMWQGNGVHFVEVKTRTGSEYGTPGAAVTYTKQQKLRSDLCFDVIEVWVVGKTAKIRWLQSCF